MKATIFIFAGAMLSVPVLPNSVSAQEFPNRPLRFVVPFPPGGGADNLARVVGQKVGDQLGQQVVIDNRGGAGGNIAAEVAAQADPNGYTLLQGNVAHTISRTLYRKLNYDFVKDFSPVTQLASIPFILLVTPSLPVSSVADLIALAKSKAGALNYASSGTGGPSHMAMELFKTATGTDLTHVPYKGAGPAAIDVVAGRVNMMFFTLSAARSHLSSGKLKPIAITSVERVPQAATIPTFKEAGVSDLEVSTWFGVLVPAGTPKPVIDRLHKSFVAALSAPEVKTQLSRGGFQLVGSSPEAFGAYIKAEIARWAKVIKTAGIPIN